MYISIMNGEHMKKIAILGSTGSIGTQTLEIVREAFRSTDS